MNMKNQVAVVVIMVIALVAIPVVSNALSINVLSQARLVEADAEVSNLFNPVPIDIDSAHFQTGSPGLWFESAEARAEEYTCTVVAFCSDPGPLKYWADATATQESNIDLAPDGSSLTLDVYQRSTADASGVGTETTDQTRASYANLFEVLFSLEQPLDYTLTAAFFNAYGTAPITLTKFDMNNNYVGAVFSHLSSWSGTDTGLLDGGYKYAFRVNSELVIFNNSDHSGDPVSMNLSLLIGSSEQQSVPEPSTLLLLGTGLIGLVGMRRKFRG